MGRCRIVMPEVVRISISDGDWIEVKKRLNYGEKVAASAALIQDMHGDGRITPRVDMMAGTAQVLAYLVDWSLVDTTDKRIAIDTDARKLAAVKMLDEATMREIETAITAHREQMERESEAQKNGQAGESASSTISPSAAS
jgi:hypothetical protein